MSDLNAYELLEVLRAAYEPNHHLNERASKSAVKRLVKEGLAVEHGRTPEELCQCAGHILTKAGLDLAAEHGITRTWADEAVSA
jgi:hypothetical protein